MPEQAANQVQIERAGDRFAERSRFDRGAVRRPGTERFRTKAMPRHVRDHVRRHVVLDEDVAALVGAPERQVEKDGAVPARQMMGKNSKRVTVSTQGLFQIGVELDVTKRVFIVDREIVQRHPGEPGGLRFRHPLTQHEQCARSLPSGSA